jgi:L-amino acid N-acyltransferase YncA
MISNDIIFELYRESDAQQVADLLNRNRFHAARNKFVTAEDYLFTQRSRGVYFSVVAKKKGQVIGLAGAYPTSDQHVAKKHQIHVGTFLVDMKYRLSYTVIMGLFDMLMKHIAKSEFKEILSGVRPYNESSYHLMLKCGFVLVDATPNEFGRVGLRNYSPALARYAGAESAEVSSNAFFASLPVIDRKEARKNTAKPILHERYIEVDYKLDGEDVILLFDIVNLKIDGGYVPKQSKFYPLFGSPGKYLLENLHKSKAFDETIEMVMRPDSEQDNVTFKISLEPGQSKIVECSAEVSELRFTRNGKWYMLYPNDFMEVSVPKEPVKLSCGKLSIKLEPSTGFISVMDGEKKLATLIWPCAVFPYIEGIFVPREKDLRVETSENRLVVTEETDEYKLTRICSLSENEMDVTTKLECKSGVKNVRPIAQIYAEQGVLGYSLKSGEKEINYEQNAIMHEGYEYSDYTYWITKAEPFADSTIECISLKYPSSVVDIVIDKNCSPIDHAPVFTSTLVAEEILEEQVIEQMKVYYRTEDIK